MLSARHAVMAFVLWMGVLTIAMYTLRAFQTEIWAAIGVSSAAAIFTGVARHRPRRKVLWLLLALGVFAFVTADTTYDLLEQINGDANPFPSAADGIYLLCTFPALGLGLYGLARSGATGKDRAATLDALIMTAGLALLSWIFLINPLVHETESTTVQKAISIAYPLYDVLVLAAIARLLATVRLTATVGLLGLGGAGLFIGDVLYGLSQLSVGWATGGWPDLLYILWYASWGAAALHPSMVRLTDPKVDRSSELTNRRLVVLTLSSLIAPIVLLAQALRGDVRDGLVIALFSAALFLLVLARLSGVLKEHRQAVARERGLREAGAVLLTTTEANEVYTAVRAAVAQLMPVGAAHALHFVITREGSTPPVERIQMVYTRTLAERDRVHLGAFEVTLRCPLVLDGTAEAAVGELMVGADEQVLIALQDALEVLSSQAALALARVSLSREINQRRNEEYFRTLVQNTADVILILDQANHIRYASPSAEHVFQTEPGELTGALLVNLVEPVDREIAARYLEVVRTSGGIAAGYWRMLGGIQIEVSCRDLRDDETVEGLVVTLRDVTEQRRLEDELTRRAFYDSLTGLANRALFQERLQQALTRAARGGGVVGVLFCDLDDFKVVNDTLGHEAGDELLVAVANRLTGAAEPHGTVARLGGDEYAVLVEDTASPAEVELVADRIIEAFGHPFTMAAGTLNAMVSIGVAATDEATGGDDLLRQADLALYLAKGDGKGRWRRFQAALHMAVRERMELRTAMEKALSEETFLLQYQPIVDLPTGTAVGFEALIRWPHPTRGFVPPMQFIEIAEETGFIVPLGAWVLQQALDTAVRWRAIAGDNTPYLSVNVSARQFRAAGFVDKVAAELSQRNLPASCLMLEITESLLLRDENNVLEDLNALRDMGVRIAIDDFGTGYSSLSYLRQVPVDVLKIDKSFVDTVATSRQQHALVEGIVTLAHTLGLKVVVEGIEQQPERDLLQAMGCEFGQGYLFARPLSYSDASQLIFNDRVAA
jgi:diguanylate cyclase (GGDEF)-like protein/PAS domain S-box-containing protein